MWARAITLWLRARRKFGFLDGSVTKPTDETMLLHWDTVNSMIVSWLLRSIDPKLVSTIPFHDEARNLWAYLERRYCVANGPLKQLRAAITECRQGKTQSLEDYYTKLISLFNEFARMKPLHSCECNGCQCNLD